MYDGLFSSLEVIGAEPVARLYGDDFVVDDRIVEARVHGELAGMTGNGRRVRFRIHHVFRFRDGKICYENPWLDMAAIAVQLGRQPAAAH